MDGRERPAKGRVFCWSMELRSEIGVFSGASRTPPAIALTDRQTDRQAGRQTDRQADRKTGRVLRLVL